MRPYPVPPSRDGFWVRGRYTATHMKVLPVVPGEGRDVALPGAINTPADNRVTMEIGAAPIDIGGARAAG